MTVYSDMVSRKKKQHNTHDKHMYIFSHWPLRFHPEGIYLIDAFS